MGGPMDYARFINRNGLGGWGYLAEPGDPVSDHEPHPGLTHYYLEGELRRMEADTFEPTRIAAHALQAGVTDEQAARLLRQFLGIPEPGCKACANWYHHERGHRVQLGRCAKHNVD